MQAHRAQPSPSSLARTEAGPASCSSEHMRAEQHGELASAERRHAAHVPPPDMRSRPKLRGVGRHPLRSHRAPLAPGEERRARRVPAKEPAIGGGPRSTPHASGAENATAECSAAKPAIVTSATLLCRWCASVTGIPGKSASCKAYVRGHICFCRQFAPRIKLT